MQRFRDFFNELSEIFVEREDVLAQCQLGLLARQHVLMTGPPGTAKSQLASLVLGRILDEDTGRPSLFARQFTESTVQTDLVGPLNFKTLMETGRTEHFTDEGILGSVHAFLDEVFDGRDMLLRSTLNLLHERELKQGGATTRGHIESAFMTSNRYISEILDSSRETMLAFIDRISFISFVPRGFAAPGSLELVVRRHGGGYGRHAPKAALTVQDLDILQRATELTYVPAQICDAVTTLVRMLDDELAAARRADPAFQPTRYLSTRTAVHAANILRAVVVHRKIFDRAARRLEAVYEDLADLRYNLLLAGLSPSGIAARLERETDPRERRQLDIMRTEAEIFTRCLAKVPKPEQTDAPPTLPLTALRAAVHDARNSGSSNQTLEVVRELVTATESGIQGADRAGQLLVEAVGSLAEHALRAGLAPNLPTDADPESVTTELAQVADNLERAGADTRPMALWLRGRLYQFLHESLTLTPLDHDSVAILAADSDEAAILGQLEARLLATEKLQHLRAVLDSGGPWHGDAQRCDDAWRAALARLDEELALLMDRLFVQTAHRLLAGATKRPLASVLRDLEPFIQRVRAVVDRLDELGHSSRLEQTVMGPRLAPMIEHAFRSIDGHDRPAAIKTAESVVTELERVGLDLVVTPQRFVSWMSAPLLRDETARKAKLPDVRGRADFEALQGREAALSLTATLVQVAVLALPRDARRPAEPTKASDAVRDVMRELDRGVVEAIVEADLARVERGVRGLEGWWTELRASSSDTEPLAPLELVVSSGFLRVIRGNVPVELALELNQLVDTFPSCAERAQALRGRLVSLDDSSTEFLVTLLERKSQQAWTSALDSDT